MQCLNSRCVLVHQQMLTVSGIFVMHVFNNFFPNCSLAIEPAMDTMVFLNMGFDISCLILVLVSYFTVMATMVCIGNHWDAVYRSTGEVRINEKTYRVLMLHTVHTKNRL